MAAAAHRHFDAAAAAMAHCAPKAMKPARLMGATYAALLDRLQQRGWSNPRDPRPPRQVAKAENSRKTPDMNNISPPATTSVRPAAGSASSPLPPRKGPGVGSRGEHEPRYQTKPTHIHIIGAGVAGLAAALSLTKAGRHVTIHEASPQAGGRCRSYIDRALGCRIDNGNHLLLSGNHANFAYLDEIGAADTMEGPARPLFPFYDVTTDEHWTLRPNLGRIPWWMLVPSRRVPGMRLRDALPAPLPPQGPARAHRRPGPAARRPLPPPPRTPRRRRPPTPRPTRRAPASSAPS